MLSRSDCRIRLLVPVLAWVGCGWFSMSIGTAQALPLNPSAPTSSVANQANAMQSPQSLPDVEADAVTAVPGPNPTVTAQAPTGSNSTGSTAAAQGERDVLAEWLNKVAEQQQLLQSDAQRPPEVTEALTKAYEQMRASLETALKTRQRRLQRLESIASAPGLLDAARARRQQIETAKPPATEELKLMTFEEVDQRRQTLEAELASAAAERTELIERTNKREKRRKELPQLISDTKAKLDQSSNQPPPPPSEDPLVREAATWSKEISQRLLSEQLQDYEAEQRLDEAEAALLPLQIELAQTTEKRLQDRLRETNEQLDKIRTDRILGKFSEAKRLVVGLPQTMQPLGDQLLEYIESWRLLAAKQAGINSELETAQEVLDRWNSRRLQMETRVTPTEQGVSSFNIWVGLMLRKQRGELPDPQQLENRIRSYQAEMQETESMLFDLEDNLVDVKSRLDAVQEELSELQDLDDADPRLTHAAALLKLSVEVMQAFKIDGDTYLSHLYEVADLRASTIELSREYRDFIDKHVLWIRSSEPLSAGHWPPTLEAFRWLVDYRNWQNAGRLLLLDIRHRLAWYVVFGVIFLTIIFNQARMRRMIGQYSVRAEKNNCTDFRWTSRGLLLTLLVASPVPLAMLFLHWRLSAVATSGLTLDMATDFATALARGLLLATAVFFPLEILRQLSRLGGLGIKHFGWPESVARRLGTNLRWFIDFTIPLCIVIGIFLTYVDERWEASLGRLAFLLLMPILSFFLVRVFSPRSGIVQGYLEQHRGGWLDRLSAVWFLALVLLPLALGAVSLVGYHYTAQRIAAHLVSSLWTVVGLIIAYCLLMRLLMLNRRRLMLAQARQRLQDASRRESAAEPALGVEESRIDLVAVNEQTGRLVRSLIVAAALVLGFFIWSDVLPAVSMLEEVELWTVRGNVPEDTVVITLANLLLVIPAGVLLVIAVRNVPGLLEIAFLQHLPLTNAARYAITTLSRYAIIGLGILIVSTTIGLRWSSIQWLVAALGVGLGFGLQEIFANFVSGLILLFEQPIRVGDIVSIDGTTGTISKIRMRATTIVNWDRQELIVPNKDLITGKLLNWTLTDSTNRIVVNVGVAYGCDTKRACELIMQVCRDHPNILTDPQPLVTFEGFGDNSLTLVLRAFLDSLENRLKTIHELHQTIYQTFNDEGIEIAFPQRDLHIRSFPEGWNRLFARELREAQSAAPPSGGNGAAG